MKIAGLQKMTLLDFPGKVACTVFLPGCNFRCPFCHNGQILDNSVESAMEPEALLSFLKKRQGLLDGVCVTGGEPTLQPDLPAFLRSIKTLGYPVKLDTNGSNPQVLKALVAEHLVDYVAMDVKNSPEAYPLTTGNANLSLSPVQESLAFLLEDHVDYELRTTVVAELHSPEHIAEMGKWVQTVALGKKAKKWFLQFFVARDSVPDSRLSPPKDVQMFEYVEILTPYANKIEVRG